MLRLDQRSVWGSAPQQLRLDPKAGRNTPLARYSGQTANHESGRSATGAHSWRRQQYLEAILRQLADCSICPQLKRGWAPFMSHS